MPRQNNGTLCVLGLPLVVVTKTLYTHRSHVLGLARFPTLHPARALDTLHRNPHIHPFSTMSCGTPSPYGLVLEAVSKSGPAPTSITTPLDVA